MTKKKLIKRKGKPINIFANGGTSTMGNIASSIASGAGSIINTGLKQSQIADTSELESVIKQKGSYQVGARNNEDLLKEWGQNSNINSVDYEDLMASKGESAGNILGGMVSGAAAGMSAGPWGAAAGAVVGLASGIFGRGAARRKAKNKANALNRDITTVNQHALESLNTRAENIDTQSDLNALANYSAYGGKLNTYDNGGTLSKVTDIGLSMIPIVGTVIDAKKFYNDPTWENAGWLGVSAASDLLGMTAIKSLAKGAKIAKSTSNTLKESRITKELAYNTAKKRAASLEKTGNPNKIVQASNLRSTAYNDAYVQHSDKILNKAYNNAVKSSTKHKSALISAFGSDLVGNSIQNFPEILNKEHFNNMKNTYKSGGNLRNINQHGGEFTNGITMIGNGGTHEENPNEGVQLGVDPEGIPNLVEEGEVKFNDYIFSNRLSPKKELLNDYKLPSKLSNYSFASAAEKLNKESIERPNDPISKRGLVASMTRLQGAQEMIRDKENTNNNIFRDGGIPLTMSSRMSALRNLAENQPIVRQEAPAMPFVNQKQGKVKTGFNLDESFLRYAPIVGSGLSLLMSGRPDYSNADSIMEAANSVRDVSYNPIGNYLTYNPMDRDYYTNKLNANAGATRRSIENQAGGNRANATAGILAADYNYGQSLGTLARQSEEYNLQQRQLVEQFNRGTNQANSEMGLRASIANQSKDSNKVNAAIARAQMREQIDERRSLGKSANLTNLFDSLGDIGREKVSRNMISSDPSLYYSIDNKGNVFYKDAFQSLSFKDQQAIRAQIKSSKKSKGGYLV